MQIVLTQPEEQDKTIKETYFRAVTQASLAAGYLYVENQYFQYEDWAAALAGRAQEGGRRLEGRQCQGGQES